MSLNMPLLSEPPSKSKGYIIRQFVDSNLCVTPTGTGLVSFFRSSSIHEMNERPTSSGQTFGVCCDRWAIHLLLLELYFMLILHLACMKVDEKTIIQFKTARREPQRQSLNWCVVKTTLLLRTVFQRTDRPDRRCCGTVRPIIKTTLPKQNKAKTHMSY